MFSRLKNVWRWGMALKKEDGEEMEKFCNDLYRIVYKVGSEYRFCVLKDLNG